MDKKEHIKITLLTFLLIISFIIIILMAYFIYKNYHTETLLKENIANLKDEFSLKNNNQTTSKEVISSNSTDDVLSASTMNATFSETEALQTAKNIYETAYKMFEYENIIIPGTYNIKGKQQKTNKINISKLESVFSKKAIDKIKGCLFESDNEYYDYDPNYNRDGSKFLEFIDVATIFSRVDSGIRNLSLIVYNENYIVVTGKLDDNEVFSYPEYLILIKENGKWLIDLYE